MSDPSAERWILCCDEEQIQFAEKGNAEEGIGIFRCALNDNIKPIGDEEVFEEIFSGG